jgi:hypothetical protein
VNGGVCMKRRSIMSCNKWRAALLSGMPQMLQPPLQLSVHALASAATAPATPPPAFAQPRPASVPGRSSALRTSAAAVAGASVKPALTPRAA